ncbi:response regulator transcription factor [Bacillus mycoides]|uniref:response regulator transcription factor n=1 Tax=Bacillus cereus group TaxID=86661 RepID=UPI00103CBAC4|nr:MULTISPECIES: response regulator transcription factor [Bacillus cereus group]QWG36857.1 response regulator transcription factor [Bacillus mycoides]QWG48287.1 response regulator transcription factor [Bacillus mycoides]TBX77448.1 response regulator transcription factor [Bacillus mycoides]WJE22907.1 response regulator transcription factor [Bacillus cereus]
MIHNIPDVYTKKILIVDDEKEILNLLEAVLKKEGFQHIYTYTTGEEGIRMCKQVQPDLIILDIMLPDLDGYSVCQQIRQFTFVPIFFLSAKNEDLDKILGLSIGGDDYITKPFSPKEVAYKMKAFFRRNQYQEKARIMYQFGDIKIDEAQGTVLRGDTLLTLTAKEFNILLFLIKNPNQIFSKARLYEAVWGEAYLGNDNIMMVHMRHLREKIEDNPSKPHYLVTVRGLGYKLNTKGDVR